MLCYYAFPLCQNGVGLPLCYEDCMAIKLQFCFNDWALIEDNKLRGRNIISRGHFRLPECETLPRYTNNKALCSHVSLTVMDKDYITCISVILKMKYIIIYFVLLIC